jgi:hypothetical protein
MKKAAVATGHFESSVTPATETRFLKYLDERVGCKLLLPSRRYRMHVTATRILMVDPVKLTKILLSIQQIMPRKLRYSRSTILRKVGAMQRRLKPKPPFVDLAVEEMTAWYRRKP